MSSSFEIFEYLLLHGANPFIKNIKNEDAFDMACKAGNYHFLNYIINLKNFQRYSYNDKYLLSLVQNNKNDIIKIFEKYININSFENYNIVDNEMNTLLILSCLGNNPEITSILLKNGINPLIKNVNGFNCLHICAYRNSYNCAGLVLSRLEEFEEYDKIIKILTEKNNFSETPLHIAAKRNLEDISLLFISFLKKNNIKIDMVKNGAGLTPLQLAIKNHNYKIALMYIKYLNLNITDLLDLKNLSIEREYDDFMYCYDSALLKDDVKIIDEKYSNIEYFKKKEIYFLKIIRSIIKRNYINLKI